MLMLILIKTGNENEVNTNFNTSHVNVNREKFALQCVTNIISIHLMLMLIISAVFYIQ